MKIFSMKINHYLAVVLLFLLFFNIKCTKKEKSTIKIHYLGHSSFVLKFDNGTTIVTDYGKYNAWEKWGWNSPIHKMGDLVPDVMTYSHKHEDHFAPERKPKGVEYILMDEDSLTINGIEIIPFKTCEDSLSAAHNTSYLFTYKNLKILHLGDAQANIFNIDNKEVKDQMVTLFPQSLDLLLMPIEGKTQFIPQAESFIALLKPKRIIPMHYWTQQYCEEFLDYIEKQKSSKKSYYINKIDGPHYTLSSTRAENPIQIIKLTRAEYAVLND